MPTIDVAVLPRGDHRGAAAAAAATAAPDRGAEPFDDEQLTVLIVLVLGVLVAPTVFGHGVVDVVGQLATGLTEAGR